MSSITELLGKKSIERIIGQLQPNYGGVIKLLESIPQWQIDLDRRATKFATIQMPFRIRRFFSRHGYFRWRLIHRGLRPYEKFQLFLRVKKIKPPKYVKQWLRKNFPKVKFKYVAKNPIDPKLISYDIFYT